MEYKDFTSKADDIVWLAYKLKNECGSKISINRSGLYKEVLEGRYNLVGCDRGGINFSILYSDKEFLRVEVGEGEAYDSSYEKKLFVLMRLKSAIGNIVRDEVSLGEPSVFYNIKDEEYLIPHLEYIYADKEKTIRAFQDKTIFDDGSILEDVIVFDSEKKGEEFAISKKYSYIAPGSSDKYGIGIYAMLENRSNIETMNLKKILIDNLNDQFYDNLDNLFIDYECYDNDIVYLVTCIRGILSLVKELEIYLVINKDGKEIHNVRYVNDYLVKYASSSKIFEYNLNTYYDIENGIKFDTNCAMEASDVIGKCITAELEKINSLRHVSIRNNVKTNQSLLKLVKKIGNR